MSHSLWPVDQLLGWLDTVDSCFFNIKSTEIMTLIALLKFADNITFSCYPSVSRLAKIMLRDKKMVEDSLKKLIQKEIISVEKRYTKEGDRDNNKYQFHVGKLFKVGAFSPLPIVNKKSGVGVKPPPRWGLNHPYGRGEFTPLTTNITTQETKKKRDLIEKNTDKQLASTKFLKGGRDRGEITPRLKEILDSANIKH